jgi:hypothetical protein
MPILKSIQSGNFTDSSTWVVIDPGTFLFSRPIYIGQSFNMTVPQNTATFIPSSNITILGHMLHFGGISTTPTGTITSVFRNVTTSTNLKSVTINVSDLPQTNGLGSMGLGWVFFKYDSPITLNNTNSYQIQTTSSSSNQASLYISAAIERALVTNVNAAPLSGDTLIINGEFTSPGVNSRYIVTMNSTSRIPGYADTYVDPLGTLRWADTPSSNFHLRFENNLWVRGLGQLIMGDESSPIPPTTNALLEITSSVADRPILLTTNGLFRTFGTPTTVKTEINGDIVVSARTFNTSTVTDWVPGDRIVIAGTTRTANQNDVLTITGVTGATIATSTPFLFPHLGTGDTVADVAKLNRNVKIFSTSSSFPSRILNSSDNRLLRTLIDINNTEIYDMGGSSFGSIYSPGGSIILRNSSLYNTTIRGSVFINFDNVTQSATTDNNFFYNTTSRVITSGANTFLSRFTVTNNLAIGTGGFNIPVNGNFDNNTICGLLGGNAITTFNLFSGTMDNLKIYSMGSGINFNTGIAITNQFNPSNNTINNARIFRINGAAITLSSTNSIPNQIPLYFNNARFFGIFNQIFNIAGFSNINMVFRDSSFWGGSGEVTGTLINRGSVYGNTLNRLFFDNCNFGLDYSGNTSNFISAILPLNGSQNAFFDNCLFSGTESSTPGIPVERFTGYVSVNHNRIPGAMRTFKSSCIILKDTTIFDDFSSSIRLIPQSTNFEAISDIYKVPAKSGQTITVSVRVRKSASPDTPYNGIQPQLILLINPSIGVLSNTIVATGTTSNGVWETLSYTTPVLNADTVLEFNILCNGTAGFINISNFKTNTFNNSKTNEYWGFDGSYIEPSFRRPGIQISSVF